MAQNPKVYIARNSQMGYSIIAAHDFWQFSGIGFDDQRDVEGSKEEHTCRTHRKGLTDLPAEVHDIIFAHAYGHIGNLTLRIEDYTEPALVQGLRRRSPLTHSKRTLITLPESIDELFVSRMYLDRALLRYGRSVYCTITDVCIKDPLASINSGSPLHLLLHGLFNKTKFLTVQPNNTISDSYLQNKLLLPKLTNMTVERGGLFWCRSALNTARPKRKDQLVESRRPLAGLTLDLILLKGCPSRPKHRLRILLDQWANGDTIFRQAVRLAKTDVSRVNFLVAVRCRWRDQDREQDLTLHFENDLSRGEGFTCINVPETR